ncbi:hypothetical protein H072_692 [Dactylellina haptotyla CBS 200.50]|uniref:Ig-like domain-containing protein n=1 Tax=Dactylellina haptotyla (strain CBS 200.50) TaxID=1284197 RepID=S8AQT1_DACHA|nr:hypothetical protein H072_692 [Dactylellina haptotyla CBS 200.50]
MFFLKSLVAALALGLVQESIAAAASSCCTDKCGKPVRLAKNGRRDCSAILVKTITPTKYTTNYKTATHTVYRTVVKKVTGTTDIIVTRVATKTDTKLATETDTDIVTETETDIASETEYSVSTSLSTAEETQFVTEVATATETSFSTLTVSFVPTLKKRAYTPAKPTYASACDNGAYTRACSCLGIKPITITRPAYKRTVSKTRTVYKTLTRTSTSYAAVNTHTVVVSHTQTNIESLTQTDVLSLTATDVVSLTTRTTIISGTEIIATETITLTVSTDTTVTNTVVATQTADPAPPVCNGNGFGMYVQNPASSQNGYGLGNINSIGVGIYLRTFSGGAAPWKVDSSGNIISWYTTSDLQMLVKTGSPPYKIWYRSSLSNVNYNVPTEDVSCQVGTGPDYKVSCIGPGGAPFKLAMCQDPIYYEWVGTLYSDAAQLSGMNCVLDSIVARCKP